MCSSQFVSQQSFDMDIYLPSEIDFEETLLYQSADDLIHSIDFDSVSSVYRTVSGPVNSIGDNIRPSPVVSNDEPLSIANNNSDMNDVNAYLDEPSTVVPHLSFSLAPVESSSAAIMNKKFMVYDDTTGRERRPLLHEFIRLVLENDEYSHIAEYVDRKQGIFKLNQPKVISELWKHVKGRNSDSKMTYDKLARAIRYYYGSGIIISSPGRFTFRFGAKSGFGTTWWPVY